MAEHNDLGRWGEDMVVERLLLEGYTVVERNWRLGHLEVDIIATKGEDLIFVEVKTRSEPYADPLEAMTPKKIAQLCRAAETYIRMQRVPLNPRFDVAAVVGGPEGYRLDYYPNAFLPPLRSY